MMTWTGMQMEGHMEMSLTLQSAQDLGAVVRALLGDVPEITNDAARNAMHALHVTQYEDVTEAVLGQIVDRLMADLGHDMGGLA